LAVKAQIPIIAFTIAALAWPFLQKRATNGLDESWKIGLHLAAVNSLRQGVDIVFTYGPLGFLSVPAPYVGFTSLLAIIASFAVYAALILVMLLAARRIMPIWAAALVTLLVARFFASLPPFEALQALVFVLAVEAMTRWRPTRQVVVAILFGVLAGVATLGKLNVGVFVASMGAIAALTVVIPAWRGVVAFAASAAVTTLVIWLVSGQRLADLGAFFGGAFQTISGYSEAMGTDRGPDLLWIYLAFVTILSLIAWLGWQMRADWTSRQRLGMVALSVVLVFALWKTAFTRGYPAYSFATFAIVLFPLAGPRLDPRVWLVSLLCVGIAIAGTSHPLPRAYADVTGSLTSLLGEVRDAVIPGRTMRAIERTRAQLRLRYALPQSMLAAVAGHRVHIDPWEAAMAYAYPEFTWAPLPVFQSYEVYTSFLDELNAARLRSPEAPDRIIREFRGWTDPPDFIRRQLGRGLRPGEALPVTVDGRFRWFESPAATLEMFCRYRQVASTGRWQVLEQSGASCGTAQPISAVTASAGTAIPVPQAPPDAFVVVRIHGINGSLLDRVRTILYKGTEWYVKLDDSRYRLVPGTAADGLILAVPPTADGTPPFAFGAPIRTISVSAGIDRHAYGATLSYEFLSVPLGTAGNVAPEEDVTQGESTTPLGNVR
jgi:hypothetical protein